MALSTGEIELHGRCGLYDLQAPRDGWEQCGHGTVMEDALRSRVLASSQGADLCSGHRSGGILRDEHRTVVQS